MTFRMLLVAASFFVLATTGLAELQVAVPPVIPAPHDTVEAALAGENVPQSLIAPLSADSTETELCVLSSDATDKRKCEYYLCLEKLSCESPRRFEDERNGNVAVMCR